MEENSTTKVCLMIVYNHRFDKNIPRLEALYRGRFSHIFHIMPFYDGNAENVIPVYENSFYFSNYIAQAYQHLKNRGFTHFFVVADDMVINPAINENSLWEVAGIEKDACFISGFLEMHKRKEWWNHIISAMHFSLKQSGVEFQNYLPSFEEAQKRFEKFGIKNKSIPRKLIWKYIRKIIFSRTLPSAKIKAFFKLLPVQRKFEYPLVGGYSDIFFVTAGTMEKFSQYCGIFAATRLFVEIAIPTSLALSADKICCCKSIKLKSHAIWTKQEKIDLETKFQKSLSNLLENYPKDIFFIHPVKLSQWK